MTRSRTLLSMLLAAGAMVALASGPAATPARGDILDVVADDVLWDVPSSPDLSPDMTFKLFNSPFDMTGDVITGWQLRLRILPEAGASGSIHFHDAFQPAANYIFDGRTDGLISIIDPSDDTMLFSFDSDNMFVGVPPDTDKTLLSVNFFTNDLANGVYDIQALGNLGDTQWSDPADRAFDNVPFDGNWHTIARVRAVPEPSSLALLAAAAPVLWLVRSRRRTKPA